MLALCRLLRRRSAPAAGTAGFISSVASLSTLSPSPRVSSLVDEIARLSLVEAADLSEALRDRLGVDHLPIMAILSPGATVGPAAPQSETPGAAAAEKTSFDVKLEGFDASARLKIIKEVRSILNLGLTEAKSVVEKAPGVVLMAGVSREDGEKVVEKLKAVGAKVVLE